jgi:hypothetical protein
MFLKSFLGNILFEGEAKVLKLLVSVQLAPTLHFHRFASHSILLMMNHIVCRVSIEILVLQG